MGVGSERVAGREAWGISRMDSVEQRKVAGVDRERRGGQVGIGRGGFRIGIQVGGCVR
jgi:hypothetical protein